MLTSKPPFQSSTTDEIYRRARERDYEWPTAESSQKFISQDAKDLVADMLQDADMRPDPDVIVQHPFFTSGYMPTENDMSPRLREVPPEREEFYATRMSSSMQAQSYRNLKDMCRECCVGPWTPVQVIHTQIWKEMAAEEKAGMTPMIPLAENLVYRPFDDWLREQQQRRAKSSSSMMSYASQPASSSDDQLASTSRPPTGLLRQPPQSFAAQQRAQSRPAASTAAKSIPPVDPMLSASQSTRTRPRHDAMRDMASKEAPDATGTMKSTRGSMRTQLPATRSAPSLQVAERAATLSSERPSLHTRQKSDSVRTASLFGPTERPRMSSWIG